MEGDTVSMQDIFRFEFGGYNEDGSIRGRLAPTQVRPRVIDKAITDGLTLPPDLARLYPMPR